MKFLVPVLLAACVLGPRSVAAQPSNSAVANADTDRLFAEGTAAFNDKRYEEAWIAFKKAYALNPTLFILHNLAVTAIKTERYLDAARLLSPVLPCTQDCPTELQEFGPDLLEQAHEHLGRLQIRAPVTGTRVEVDGDVLPQWALEKEWPVEPGAHRIEGYAGRESDAHEVTVGSGEVKRVSLQFDGDPGAQPETLGAAAERDPGPGRDQAPEQDEPNVAKTVILGAGVITTTVALTSAIVLAVSADNLREDARTLRRALGSETDCTTSADPRCSNLAETANQADNRQTLANQLFLTSSVIAAATAAAWLFWPEPTTSTTRKTGVPARAAVLPSVAPSGATLLIQGSF